MNLQQFTEARQARLLAERQPRERCPDCRNAMRACYCEGIRHFESNPRFVILINRHEARRTIATARMAHLCLTNSLLFTGLDFTHHEELNAVIADPRNHCVVLYPRWDAVDLSAMSAPERKALIPDDKELVVIVLDGTWAQAKRMRRFSENLADLPHVRFTPATPSAFGVRRQPKRDCYSTIEAIHQTIDLMGAPPSRHHDGLLNVFHSMVEQQKKFCGAVRNPR